MKKDNLKKILGGIALTLLLGIGVTSIARANDSNKYRGGEEEIWDRIYNAISEEEEEALYNDLVDFYVENKVITKDESKIYRDYIQAKTMEDQKKVYNQWLDYEVSVGKMGKEEAENLRYN